MTTTIVRAAALAALLAPTAASAQRTAAVSEFTVAGIPVIHKPITANDVIAVRVYLRGGSAALRPETAGIERFITELATHGTEKYTRDRFSALATSTGTQIGSDVSFDFTAWTLQAVRQHWNDAWDLFAQAVRHPTFPADEMHQVRGQILNQLKQRTDNPDQHLNTVADSILYRGHAYAADPLGTPAVVEGLTREQLIDWHSRRLTKENLLIVAVGNVSRADLSRKITAAFASLPARGGGAPSIAGISGGSPDVFVIPQELPTNYILGVYPAPGPASPDFPALRMATRVLSERLFEEVRTKRNLSYAVASGLGARSANLGTLYVTAVDPDTTIKVMLAEVRRIQREPVPADRLKQTINVFTTGYLMGQQTSMGQAATLGLWELAGGGWENGVRYVERLRAVTPGQVQQAAAKYLKNARFVVIGDPAKIRRELFLSLE